MVSRWPALRPLRDAAAVKPMHLGAACWKWNGNLVGCPEK